MNLTPDRERLAVEADILTHMVADWLVKHDRAEGEAMLRAFAYAVTRVVEDRRGRC